MNTQAAPKPVVPGYERLGELRERPFHVISRQPSGDPVRSIHDVLFNRRATTHFRPDPVPEVYIDAIIDLACQAPSGYNIQPWRFIVVRDRENRKRLQRAAFGQEKVGEAPVVVIALGLKDAWKATLGTVIAEGVKRDIASPMSANEISVQATNYLSSVPMDVWVTRQTMIAVTTLMYVAEAYGFDTAPMEGFDSVAVATEFLAPADAEVVALVAIGYASEPDKGYPGRFAVDQVAFRERFGASW